MKIEDNFDYFGVMECYRGSQLHFTPILGHLKGSSLRLNDATKVLIPAEECKEIRVSKRGKMLQLFSVGNVSIINCVFLQFTVVLFQFYASNPKVNF